VRKLYRGIAVATVLIGIGSGPALAQLIPPPKADGPSMNSMDMLFDRAGRVLNNITTRIESLDLNARTLTIPGGRVLTFANNLNPNNLRVGQSVMLQWEEEDGKNILHGVTPIGN
jgi:hypothetical protein